jgi:hypothetical protein
MSLFGPGANGLAQRTHVSHASPIALDAGSDHGARIHAETRRPRSRIAGTPGGLRARVPGLFPSDKLRLAQASASLNEAGLRAWLRKERVHHADLTARRAHAAEGAAFKHKVRAIAQTAALVVLSKRMQTLVGGERGRPHDGP